MDEFDTRNDATPAPEDDEQLATTRRGFLIGLNKWSAAVIGSVVAAGLLGPSSASAGGAWVNRRGGWINGGAAWVNRSGGWINGGGGGGGGGWVNRSGGGGGGAWVNKRGGGGGAWVNR
jgi:hypothetical protein